MTNVTRKEFEELVREVRNLAKKVVQIDIKQNPPPFAIPSRARIADFLDAHNTWRRGGDGDMQDVKELGVYIDYAIEELRK